MLRRTKELIRRLGTDILGVLLIILSGLTGWLPGPGGIPLFLLGLSLLAVNHEWARRWQNLVKEHGLTFFRKLFPQDNRLVKGLYDVLTVALLAGAYLLATKAEKYFLRSLALSLSLLALFIFMSNRQRLKRLTKQFRAWVRR